MTEEFKRRMSEAMEYRILVAKKQDKEYLEKISKNQKYADLYMELVLALVEQYDFVSNTFAEENLNAEFLRQFGKPREVFAHISDETSEGKIHLDYQDENNPWGRSGEPAFKKSKDFDLKVVNDILAENGIHIKEDSVDGGGYGSNDDIIIFDATMLVETRKALAEESPLQYQKVNRKKD